MLSKVANLLSGSTCGLGHAGFPNTVLMVEILRWIRKGNQQFPISVLTLVMQLFRVVGLWHFPSLTSNMSIKCCPLVGISGVRQVEQ